MINRYAPPTAIALAHVLGAGVHLLQFALSVVAIWLSRRTRVTEPGRAPLSEEQHNSPTAHHPNSPMHANSDVIELKMSPVGPFYSQRDEDSFFAWLREIKCVTKFEGRLNVLHLEVCVSQVDERGLRELLSLFRRYDLDLQQLAVFDREEFAPWFRNLEAYWYPLFFSKGQ